MLPLVVEAVMVVLGLVVVVVVVELALALSLEASRAVARPPARELALVVEELPRLLVAAPLQQHPQRKARPWLLRLENEGGSASVVASSMGPAVIRLVLLARPRCIPMLPLVVLFSPTMIGWTWRATMSTGLRFWLGLVTNPTDQCRS